MRALSLFGFVRALLLYVLNKHQKPEEKISRNLKAEMNNTDEPVIVVITLPHGSCGSGYSGGESLSRELKNKFSVIRVKIQGDTFLAALTPEQIAFASRKRWVREINLAKDVLSFREYMVRQDCVKRGEVDKVDERLGKLREFYSI